MTCNTGIWLHYYPYGKFFKQFYRQVKLLYLE